MNSDKPTDNKITLSNRLFFAILISFIVLIVPYLLMVNSAFFLMEGGSAHYLVLARSISSGHGMSEMFLPEPIPHTKTPFMFPLMLAGIDLVFGYNMIAVKILLFAFMVIAAIFIYLAIRREAPFWLAIAVSCLTLISPLILSLMRRVLTEIPYLAFSFAALYFALKILNKEGKKKDWILFSVLIFLAYFTRTIAFTLIAAFLIIMLFRAIRQKEGRKDLAYGIAATSPTIFAAILWAFRGFRARGAAGLDYMSEILVKTHPYSVLMGATDLEAPLRPVMEKAGPLDLIQRMWEQVNFFLRTIAQTIDPWLPLEGTMGWQWIVFGPVVIFCFLGLIVILKQGKTLIPLYFMIFLFIICLWPYRDPRFVIPILPVFLYFMMSGVEKIMDITLPKADFQSSKMQSIKIPSAIALLILVAVLNFIADSRIIMDSRSSTGSIREYEITDHFNVKTTAGAKYRLLLNLQWVREKTPENAVIMFHSPRVVFLITDRKCVNVPITKDIDKFWEYIDDKNVDYIIVDELYREIGGGINLFTPEYLIPALNARKHRYTTAFRVPDSQSAVVKVIHPAQNQ